MPRFFISGSLQQGDATSITGKDARHITRVLRMKPGDTLNLVDGSGTEFSARITAASAHQVVVDVIRENVGSSREPQVHITIFQGLPKGNKMDEVIRRNTEIGVSRFVPVITERVSPGLMRPPLPREWRDGDGLRKRLPSSPAGNRCLMSLMS